MCWAGYIRDTPSTNIIYGLKYMNTCGSGVLSKNLSVEYVGYGKSDQALEKTTVKQRVAFTQ